VVLDPQRILPHQVAGELPHRGGGRVEKSPGAGFAEADDALVGGDLDEQVSIDELGFDAGDLHRGVLRDQEFQG